MAMDGEQCAAPGTCAGAEDPWRLSRLEIRTSLLPRQWPVARVEILHAQRGRLTDLAYRKEPLECVFEAIGRIMGFDATVRSLELDYRPTGASEGGDEAQGRAAVAITLAVADRDYRGAGRSDDVVQSCALAYVAALAAADRDREAEGGGSRLPRWQPDGLIGSGPW